MPAASMARASPKSLFDPPRNVEYTSAEPVAFSLVTKTSNKVSKAPGLWIGSKAPGAVGKSADLVEPAT